jgi:hypothetical protein
MTYGNTGFILACVLSMTAGCANHKSGTDPGDGPESRTQPAMGDRPRVWLESSSTAEDDSIDLDLSYQQGKDVDGPRVLEIRLSSEGPFELESATAGDALTQAGKELKAQQPEPGVIRLLAYSASSTKAVHGGVLAHLTLHRTGPGKGRFDIITDRPLFAPQSAQAGLTIGDPLEL